MIDQSSVAYGLMIGLPLLAVVLGIIWIYNKMGIKYKKEKDTKRSDEE